MKKNITPRHRFFVFVGSNKFFWAIVLLLILEAGWIALTGRYPMAFDEDFHLGLIKIYTHHISPFWDGQASGGDAFGAVARDPSYFYHYIMSFPYRAIEAVTSNLMAQVLILRAINITFFVGGLVVYRRLLAKVGASTQIVNLCLLVFVLIPVTPLLAAQINYDNVIIPLTGLALLLALALKQNSTKKHVDVRGLLWLIIVCLCASIVKYAFLPIFIAIIVFTIVFFKGKYQTIKELRIALLHGWSKIGKIVAASMILAIVLLGGLFIERYGVNILRYHKPVPDCAEVLDYDHCQYYGPWIRDYNFKEQKGNAETSLNNFAFEWIRGMWLRSFFAVDGPASDFQTRGPLTIPGWSGIIFGTLGFIALCLKAKTVWRKYNNSALWLLLGTTLGYLLVLFATNYSMYIETARPVAINGRYLLPVMPFMILLSALGVKEITKNYPKLQIGLVCLIILGFTWGGGALTYILRSNDSWYWHNQHIKVINHAVQNSIGPITPGYRQPTQFLY